MNGSATSNAAWRSTAQGLALRVRLTPRSARDAIEGLEETAEGKAVKARVRAVPENGAANTALERLVADWLSLPKSSVTLAAGGKSRIKTVTISGDPVALKKLVEKKLEDAG